MIMFSAIWLVAVGVLVAESTSAPSFEAEDFLLFDNKRPLLHPEDFRPKKVSFQEWLNATQSAPDHIFDHSALSEGEVLLFRTKKNKHRAIPVMRASPAGVSSRFSDSLTFKEWLKDIHTSDKAVRISVKSTDVVRPVIQHLHTVRNNFTTPIIIHANTFASRHYSERPVDPVIFVETASELLPEATISLGWTPSTDYASKNILDWSRVFKLMSYISDLRQPVLLTMALNDALHSLDQAEWLLGIGQPEVFLLVRAEGTDFVDAGEDSLQRLNNLAATTEKVFFDADDSWRRRLSRVPEKGRKRKRSVDTENWTSVVFPSSQDLLSTGIVSRTGIAFLGWPAALLLSNTEAPTYPAQQTVSGRVMFQPKRSARHVTPLRDTGLVVQLFDRDRLALDSAAIPDAIHILVGYDGQVSITNDLRKLEPHYHKSANSKLPRERCYEFVVTDKGWRVNAEVWTDPFCGGPASNMSSSASRRTFLTLDTPVSRTRKLRSVAVAKSGDGVVDFLVNRLEHNDAPSSSQLPSGLVLVVVLFLPYYAFQ